MTKEVHSIQHRKGDVELILNNLKRIVDLKKEHKSNITLMLDYILYNHNKHELELAREFAKNYNIFNIRLETLQEWKKQRAAYKSLYRLVLVIVKRFSKFECRFTSLLRIR